MSATNDEPSLGQRIKSVAIIVGVLLAALWAIEIVDQMLGEPLNQFGVRPRRLSGLSGILAMPFLHGGFGHLSANSGPLVVFSSLLLLRSKAEFALVFVATTVLGGLGVWLFGSLFGPNSVHIRASGVIFGMFGYLVSMGIFERKMGSIALSVVLIGVYGGLIYGVLPGQEGVSWEGHLFGFISGIATARFVAKRNRRKSDAAELASQP